MRLNLAMARLVRLAVFTAAVVPCAMVPAISAAVTQTIQLRAAGFEMRKENSIEDGTNRLELAIHGAVPSVLPFNQSAVKQNAEPARLGPNAEKPYFTVRFALPVPPENATNNVAALAGIDPAVFTHNHSPGFEILPNGDALAVWFSTPPGESESSTNTSFIQARLRYGAEEWDLPELFFKTENYNDQSGLLWNDNGTIRFFGGGRGLSDSVPFKMAASTDNGATWTLSLPQLESPANNFTAQPITSAFRGGPVPLLSSLNPIYFAMDGDKAKSFLWRSLDNGIHWRDMGGRTGGRHSVIVPLDDKGNLLSIGGKNNSINGWSPQNVSTNYGASWSESAASPFPPLGSAQRPSLIRLVDGNLFFVSDAWLQKKDQAPPAGWKFGDGCFVAISTNHGSSWHIKPLPVQLPNHQYHKFGTTGYVTARQAANSVIHILATETQPCLHYELNEAWIFSDAGDVVPEMDGGKVQRFSENFPDGKLRIRWSARICPNGRYLLDGTETSFYQNGQREHEVTYRNGHKTGAEIFWAADGVKLWTWSHDLKNHTSQWTHYWSNGKKSVESNWNTLPEARDLKRTFPGLVANGPVYQWTEAGTLSHTYHFTNGILIGATSLPSALPDPK